MKMTEQVTMSIILQFLMKLEAYPIVCTLPGVIADVCNLLEFVGYLLSINILNPLTEDKEANELIKGFRVLTEDRLR